MPLQLSSDKDAVVESFVQMLMNPSDNEIIISGGPGTGKTLLIKYLAEKMVSMKSAMEYIFGEAFQDYIITATTNPAAKVLADYCQEEVRTIYSLLKLKPKRSRTTGAMYLHQREYVLIKDTVIFVDEGSYLDDEIWSYIQKCTVNCKLVIVGDRDQLLNVGSIEPTAWRHIKNQHSLTITNRQERLPDGSENPITTLAKQFRETVQTGIWKPIDPAIYDGVNVIKMDGPQFEQFVTDEYRKNPDPKDIRIMAWRNDTVKAYNDHIRLNVHGKSGMFQPDEKVITNNAIIQGNSTIMSESTLIIDHGIECTRNGLEGVMYHFKNARGSCFVPNNRAELYQRIKMANQLQDWETYAWLKDEIGDLRAPFASTCHKAQGSSYETVAVNLNDLGECRVPDTLARLLTVAFSRASKKLVVYGQLPPKFDGRFPRP